MVLATDADRNIRHAGGNILDRRIDGHPARRTGAFDVDDRQAPAHSQILENGLSGHNAIHAIADIRALDDVRAADIRIAHGFERRCPAGACRSLLTFTVIEDKCKGCTLCARNCPANCISGDVKKPHVIDQERCLRCGVCVDNCHFDAISAT